MLLRGTHPVLHRRTLPLPGGCGGVGGCVCEPCLARHRLRIHVTEHRPSRPFACRHLLPQRGVRRSGRVRPLAGTGQPGGVSSRLEHHGKRRVLHEHRRERGRPFWRRHVGGDSAQRVRHLELGRCLGGQGHARGHVRRNRGAWMHRCDGLQLPGLRHNQRRLVRVHRTAMRVFA